MSQRVCKAQEVVFFGQNASRAIASPPKADGLLRDIHIVTDVDSLWAAIQNSADALVLLLDDGSASCHADLVKAIRRRRPQTPCVMVSLAPSIGAAVRAVRAGCTDFIAGPLSEEVLQSLLEGLWGEQAQCEPDCRRYYSDQCPPGLRIVGTSDAFSKSLETIRLVAQSRCNPVLVLGETGVGKELAAQAIHVWRYGNLDRFVAVNCATLTPNLLESELFGHVKGAFTGADKDKTGLFEVACGGSIFLDEISEMPVDLQAKLLRVLQEKSFRKVGGTRDIQCDATVIASSNRALLEESHAGRFRRDLYYRLAVFPIRIPCLREAGRRDDIPLLAEYFARELSSAPRSFSRCAVQKLLACRWLGNVRELRNVIERATILRPEGEITSGDLILDDPVGAELEMALEAAPVRSVSSADVAFIAPRAKDVQSEDSANRLPAAARAAAAGAALPSGGQEFSLEAAEREFIMRALRETNWQRTRAASLLGITRATLLAKLKRYDIRIPGAQPASAQDSAPAALD